MTWAATGVAAVGVGASIFGGLSANKAAKKAAKEQAKFTGTRRAEEIRQRKLTHAETLGEAKALAYASNLQPTGSTNRYISALDMENMREISAAKFARKKEMEAIREGAQGAGNALFYKAAGDALGAAASAYASTYTPTVATPKGGGVLDSTIGPSESLSFTDTPGGVVT